MLKIFRLTLDEKTNAKGAFKFIAGFYLTAKDQRFSCNDCLISKKVMKETKETEEKIIEDLDKNVLVAVKEQLPLLYRMLLGLGPTA